MAAEYEIFQKLELTTMSSDSIILWPSDEYTDTRSHNPIFILFFTLIVCSGFIFNIFVIYRMIRLAFKDTDQFLNGTGIFLLCMASCDMSSIIFSYFQMSITYFPGYAEIQFLPFSCKTSEFLHRCFHTFSMYCWVYMSSLRYFAAFQPMFYTTSWQAPWTLLGSTAVCSTVLNLYLFTTVTGTEGKYGCVMQLETTSKLYNTLDIIASTFIPSITILALDLQVFLCRSRRKTSDAYLQVVFPFEEDPEKMQKRLATMRRFMAVTAISIAFCIPDALFRVLRPFFGNGDNLILFYTCKALYLAKFSFNAFYLSIFVFDRNPNASRKNLRLFHEKGAVHCRVEVPRRSPC
ncbi:unnamed protein product [Caenorhabditis angaria]|uniref:G-protein coupled receptors family 1 profile domain-containing protein n=1 Tax=Caenorhabditis angaria TaxID=860376 RepID=A0A9P1J456_9PELO|nr:unnamed protein product [Caenorhabditis angaria]